MAIKLDNYIKTLPAEEQQAIQQEAEYLIAKKATLQAPRNSQAQSQQMAGKIKS